MRLLDGLGSGLAAVVERAARARRAKPMHPRGAVLRGRLERTGGSTGVAWFDGAGTDDVVVRLSRGAGLPDGWPDVHGLALRTPAGEDLLLSTTGRPVGLRHVLAAQRAVGRGTYSSVMPFRTARGPVMVAALADPPRELPTQPAALAEALDLDPWRLTLVWAPFGGAWRAFGSLVVAGRAGPELDPPVRFEPLAPPAGLGVYPWLARLREPSYRAARRGFPPGAPPGADDPPHPRPDAA
ncbi:phosphodiesterase [Actinotalea sp. JY-7876]|uniref:phosphodiesterase n=1 Tax=Actinotalea sp. JY-7876 TaxID=2758442 RepID=UPI0015F36041|nr:phosphodiesterase [Actinotalea sp. JY-7876]